MLSWIKFLKIVLPVATVATATVATVSLVSFRKVDEKRNADDEDKALNDFELQAKKFEEKTMLYSKDGQNEPVTLENDALKDKILEKFKEGENLGDLAKELPNADQIEKLLSEVKESSLEKNSPSQDPPTASDGENKGPSSQLETKPKDSMQDIEGDQSVLRDDAKQDEDIDFSKQITSDDDKESTQKQLTDEGDSQEEDSELTSDKGEPKEDQSNSGGDAENSDLEAQESTTIESTDKDELQQQKDLNAESKKDEGSEQVPQVKDAKDVVSQEESKDSQPSTLGDSGSGAQLSLQETNEGSNIKGTECNDGDSAEGKKTLSPEEVEHWEDLLNTVGDVATQLQLLVIDKN